MHEFRILAINPGSTSTKIAVYEGDKELFAKNISHPAEQIKQYARIADQFGFRRDIIVETLAENGIPANSFDAVIGRGGLVRPIPSGVYEINDKLRADLIDAPQGEHASNLGGLLAEDIAGVSKAKAYIADPVVVDEMDDVARVAGHPLFKRVSIFHALNQKAVARIYAENTGRPYAELNLIIAHLGGGISVGAHKKGRVVDVNNTLDGEGPFSPERSGTLPTGQLADICFSGKYTHEEVRKMICGRGGMVALTGLNDIREVIYRSENGDKDAAIYLDAMTYDIAKNIGAMATVLEGDVDAIIITGGIAHSGLICGMIEKRVKFIAPVTAIPGEDEMGALAQNALSVLKGNVTPKVY